VRRNFPCCCRRNSGKRVFYMMEGFAMKVMKKGFMFSLIMLLILVLIAGCSSPNNNNTNQAPASQNEGTKKPQQEESSKTEKVKIIYSMWGSAEEGKTTQETADIFNASQDRIEVEVLAIPWEN